MGCQVHPWSHYTHSECTSSGVWAQNVEVLHSDSVLARKRTGEWETAGSESGASARTQRKGGRPQDSTGNLGMALSRPSKSGICQEIGPSLAWTYPRSGDGGRPCSTFRNMGYRIQVVSDRTCIQAQAGTKFPDRLNNELTVRQVDQVDFESWYENWRRSKTKLKRFCKQYW